MEERENQHQSIAKKIAESIPLFSIKLITIILQYMEDEMTVPEVSEMSLEELEAETKMRSSPQSFPFDLKSSSLTCDSDGSGGDESLDNISYTGLSTWNRVRNEWIKGSKAKYLVKKNRRRRFASSSTSSGSSSDEDSDSDNSERNYSPETTNLEIPVIMNCLRLQKNFPTPIPLSSMVDVLTVLWDDEAIAGP